MGATRPAAAALLLGSALLFWLQPMTGRLLLAEYGGAASVWAVCLAAFQSLLLAGYAYAWLLSRAPRRLQHGLHLLLLAAATAWFWRGPATAAGSGGLPVALGVLRDVLRLAGIPFVAVAAGSTLLQHWLAHDPADRRVYRLYALSNAGSCLGLLLYPLALEPFAPLTLQRAAWTTAMAVYTLAVATVALRKTSALSVQRSALNVPGASTPVDPGRPQPTTSALSVERSAFGVPAPDHSPPTTHYSRLTTHHSPLHFWLPCLSSALLVAITTQVTQQIIALPLIWALLLGAFLFSYIIGFSDRATRRLARWRAALLALLALSPLSALPYCGPRFGGPLYALLGVLYGTVLMAVAGAWLHGRLYASRPGSAGLPRFYLLLAAGGALGGILTSLAAPLCFGFAWEYPALLLILAWLALDVGKQGQVSALNVQRSALTVLPSNPTLNAQRRTLTPQASSLNPQASSPKPQASSTLATLAAAAGVIFTAWRCSVPARGTIHRDRDFYGCIAVWERELAVSSGRQAPLRELNHNRTSHGKQYFLPGWRSRPLSYYGANSGLALAIGSHPKRLAVEPMRVGAVGLGIGSVATYARTGDTYVCYEISPAVLNVATNPALFTFLADTPASLSLKLGDGRKLLEAERAADEPRFDVLVLDAFSGDSTPLHLITREAFALYLDRLEPDGILAINISNWHMDLLPLCKGVIRAFDLDAQAFRFAGDRGQLQSLSNWALLSRRRYAYTPAGPAARADWNRVRDVPLPTDARGSALRYLGANDRAYGER